MKIRTAFSIIFNKLNGAKILKSIGYLTRPINSHDNGLNLSHDIAKDTPLRNIRTVFDVGSSYGLMTDLFLKTFPECRIYAFEPYLKAYASFGERYHKNPKVRSFQVALSDEVGKLEMFIQPDSGYNSLNEAVNKPSKEMGEQSQQVDVSTIDIFCKENLIESIDFIKIDTEGLDLRVLKGAQSMLSQRKIKYIFVECTFDRDNIQNTQFSSLNDFLEDHGFKLRAIYDQSNYGETTYITCVNALFMLQDK